MYEVDAISQKSTHFERIPGYIGVKASDGSFYRAYNTNVADVVALDQHSQRRVAGAVVGEPACGGGRVQSRQLREFEPTRDLGRLGRGITA